MSEEQKPEEKTRFSRRVKNLILGKESPDPMTVVVFILNFLFGFIFLFWSVLSYVLMIKKSVIVDVKSIDIDEIIFKHGEHLGFVGNDFLHRFTTLHAVGSVVWLIFMVGVLLLFRKNRNFMYVNLSCLGFYVGMLLFYMNFSFFNQDITMFDKIGFSVILISSLIHYFLLRKEQTGGSMNFFHDEESIE